MMKRHRYSYVLLRYRHDPLAGECVNVGVVLHSADVGFLGVRVRKTMGRLGKVFPGINKADLSAALSAVERAIGKLAPSSQPTLFGDETLDAAKLAGRALPPDNSSYVWGELCTGLTKDPAQTLDSLYNRFVARYDEDQVVRRDDAAVWQPVRDQLAKHKVLDRLEPKTVVSAIDEVQFGHAWKNGAWHCYQALSFDLASPDGIREKAARWSGHMLGISKASEAVKPYFVVGAPLDLALTQHYHRAIELLRASPLSPSVYEEGDVDDLVEEIVHDMREHDEAGGRRA
jgi:hypothetical protein